MPQRPDSRSAMVIHLRWHQHPLGLCYIKTDLPSASASGGGGVWDRTWLHGLQDIWGNAQKSWPCWQRSSKRLSHLDTEKRSQINYAGSKLLAVWSDETWQGHRSKPQAGEAWMLSSAFQKAVGYAGGRKPRDASGLPSSCCRPSSPASGNSFLPHLPLFLGGFPVSLIRSR